MLKAAILFMLLATVASLFSGLFFLVKDESRSSRVADALTLRVAIAVALLALVIWGLLSGRLPAH